MEAWLRAVLALAVLFGAQAGAEVVGGLQRWQGPLQKVNAWLIVAVGAYLTLSGTFGVI
jgi:cytochrome c biogenesis protein CcdA